MNELRPKRVLDYSVVLLNLGGPATLADIRPFLVNLFSDRDIIKLPGGPLLQRPLANFIAWRRAPKVAPHYEAIGGGSPILGFTNAQARALERRLARPCFVGMRYSPPTIERALQGAAEREAEEIVALPLFPHYSRATTGSVFNELQRAWARLGLPLRMRRVESYHDHPAYLAALAETIAEALQAFSPAERPYAHVIFSAHSLPVSFIEEGDPYLRQLEATIKGLEALIALPPWHLAFQSRSGPVRWLEPSTEATLRRLLAQRVRHLVMVPISFVSDHFETLYEMDILYRRQAEAAGATLVRTQALNDRPRFIECLARLVEDARKR
ncbi:MAG: ferrochelatase [Pseudomonadota bacterium]